MKRVTKMAWSLVATLATGLFFFLVMMETARAPHGGKKFIGGRSIASLQEEDFDHQLLHYRLCYGVQFSAETSTLERRRVCKAFLVNRLERALSVPGAYLKKPVTFECNDTAFRRPASMQNENTIYLKPNAEFTAIDLALQDNLAREITSEESDQKARSACSFLTSCKLAMTGYNFSFRKLGSCFFTKDVTHRKILIDQVGSMVFRVKNASRAKILYTELLGQYSR